jgi:hypothetical protein
MRSVILAMTLLSLATPEARAGDVDRMMQALGGREAIGRLEGLSVQADCSGPGGAFRTYVVSARPDRVFFRQSDGEDSLAVWSTSVLTWMSDGGAPQVADPHVRSFVRGHEFHLMLFDLETRFSDIKEAGSDVMGGLAGLRLNMKDAAGHPAALLLDEETAMPLALELNPEGAAGTVRVFFDAWEKKGSLLYFHAFELTEGEDRRFTYHYLSIVPGKIEPDVFKVPKGLDVPGASPAE